VYYYILKIDNGLLMDRLNTNIYFDFFEKFEQNEISERLIHFGVFESTDCNKILGIGQNWALGLGILVLTKNDGFN